MLRQGNSKLSKNIAVFDLPPIETCPNCEMCKASCYALKSQRQYKETRAHRQNNWAMTYDRNFTSYIQIELIKLKNPKRKYPIKYVRIHSSGDFYSHEYFIKWTDIAYSNPDIIFYAYTKASENCYGDIPANLIIHHSLIESPVTHEKLLNYGTPNYCAQLQHCYDGFICPDTLGHSGIQCGETCTHCMSARSNEYPVYFIKH